MALRALLVDDDARFRAIACHILVADGVDVVAQSIAAVIWCRP